MNTLVEHYLLQLQTFLPAKQRDDIAAELRESIRSTVEDRERERRPRVDRRRAERRPPRLRPPDARGGALPTDAAPDRSRRVSALLVCAAGRVDRHHRHRRAAGGNRVADGAACHAGCVCRSRSDSGGWLSKPPLS